MTTTNLSQDLYLCHPVAGHRDLDSLEVLAVEVVTVENGHAEPHGEHLALWNACKPIAANTGETTAQVVNDYLGWARTFIEYVIDYSDIKD